LGLECLYFLLQLHEIPGHRCTLETEWESVRNIEEGDFGLLVRRKVESGEENILDLLQIRLIVNVVSQIQFVGTGEASIADKADGLGKVRTFYSSCHRSNLLQIKVQ
jgi:hypothetical protein